jgi:hypothetical protein
VGLRGEELSPGRSGPSRGGVDPGVLQDRPYGGGGKPLAESDELAPECVGNPRLGSPGPCAAPGLGWAVGWVGGRVGVGGRSSGGR